MTEHRRPRNRSRFLPLIGGSVVHLNIRYSLIFRPPAYQIDKSVAMHAKHEVIHWHRNVGAARPTVSEWIINIDVGQCSLAALGINHVATEQKDMVSSADRPSRETPHRTRH